MHTESSVREYAGDPTPTRPIGDADRRALIAGIGGLAAGALLAGARTAQAGPLDPPAGPIASTPGPEPRIAVNVTNTPGNAATLFRITQAGSYYLTGNLTAQPARSAVIEIAAGGVTLDLNGFLISGAGIAQNAIRVDASAQGVVIRNGSIAGCTSHGITGSGLSLKVEHVEVGTCVGNGLDLGPMAQVRRCTARSNGTHGIRVGNNSLVEGCLSSMNTLNGIEALGGSIVNDCVVERSAVGILVYSNCSVTNCRVANNAVSAVGYWAFDSETGITLTDCRATGAGRGFWLPGGRATLSRCAASGLTGGSAAFQIGSISLLEACRAENNAGVGFLLSGRSHAAHCVAAFNTSDGFNTQGSSASSFINCTAFSNVGAGFNLADGATVQGCTANDNFGRGISVNNGGSVIDCTTRNNQSDGIAVNFSCLVRGNSCNGDGTGIGSEAAIRAAGQANRIEGNNITFADRGLLLSSGGNTVFGNSVKGCTVNFDITGGNDVGPIGSAATATSPWANIQY